MERMEREGALLKRRAKAGIGVLSSPVLQLLLLMLSKSLLRLSVKLS
jgi:hypothetical protein